MQWFLASNKSNYTYLIPADTHLPSYFSPLGIHLLQGQELLGRPKDNVYIPSTLIKFILTTHTFSPFVRQDENVKTFSI